MKFKCLDKDGKVCGTVNGADAAEALANAQGLNDSVAKVELVPGQKPPVEKKARAAKGGKPVMSAQAVMAAAAKRKKKDK